MKSINLIKGWFALRYQYSYPVTPEIGRVGKSSPDFVIPVSQKKGSLGSFFAKAEKKNQEANSQNTQDSQNSLQDEDESKIKNEDTEFYSQQQEPSPEDNTKSNIKLEQDIETESKMKSDDEDDDMKKAIALSLKDQDANGVSREGSLADNTPKGIKREMESKDSPKGTKHRRIDPAKQMKSPPKNTTKKEDEEKKSNQKITSFFGKS